MASSTDLSYLCSLGHCNSTRTVADGLDFEEKLYTREDAIELERAGFARTQIFDSTALDGNRDLGSEQTGTQIVSIMPGVKAGMVVPMVAERYEAPSWRSELDGRLANSCGFWPGSTRRIVEAERYMSTKVMFIEDELCVPQILETYKQSQLLAGTANNFQDPGFLNALVIDAFLEANHKNIDYHAWRGDYGAQDNKVKHVDGFLKILSKAQQTAVGQEMEYIFSGLSAGMFVQVLIGGELQEVAFNTDVPTTLADIKTVLDAAIGYEGTGNPLFSSVSVTGTPSLRVLAQNGEIVYLNFAVAASSGKGVKPCPDGSITAVDPASGASVTGQQLQEAQDGQTPLSLAKRAVNSTNVVQYLDEWYDLVNSTKPELLETGGGLNLLVARNVFNAYNRAVTDRDRAKDTFLGCDTFTRCLDFMGIRLVPVNYMPNDCWIAARPEDLKVGVDLASDAGNFETWYDRDCQTIKYRGAMTIGFQVAQVNNISGTLSGLDADFGFHDEMPMGIKRTNVLV